MNDAKYERWLSQFVIHNNQAYNPQEFTDLEKDRIRKRNLRKRKAEMARKTQQNDKQLYTYS